MRLDIYGETLCALVTASGLAASGHQVCLHLPRGSVREQIIAGQSVFSEPGLRRLVNQQMAEGRLQLADLQALPQDGSKAVFIAMERQQRELAEQLIDQLAGSEEQAWTLINQSPFAIGSTEALQVRLRAGQGHARSHVLSLPDLLQEGVALASLQDAPQWVLGCEHGPSELLVKEIFRPFNQERDRFLVMTPREAEFARMAITGMLVTRVSYINDMANLADSLGVDIEPVRQSMTNDPRVGKAYLQPGVGFGGSGLSGDIVNLSDTLHSTGIGTELLRQVVAINERQKELLFRKLWQHFDTELVGRTVAIWGAAFKPGTGRIDNAPVLRLLEALWAQGVKVRIHDPEAMPALLERYGHHPQLHYASHAYAAAENADALMLVTHWKEYWSPDFAQLKRLMRTPLLLDGRNIYDPVQVREQGFTYYGVGR